MLNVVRFGWRKEPDKELASQKEWLQVDMVYWACRSRHIATTIRASREPAQRISPDTANGYLR